MKIMRFLKYIIITSIMTVMLTSLSGCSDDDTNLSRAVLAGVPSLNFAGEKSVGQMITIYADADWEAEIPEWVTVSPSSGNGVTDVIITVKDNLRDGEVDKPRKTTVVFKGGSLASRSEVLILQAGNKFRDVKEYKLSELDALKDENVVSLPELFVTAATTSGFIVTDKEKTTAVYVDSDEDIFVGDKISIMGDKWTDAQSLTYLNADTIKLLEMDLPVTYPNAKDITKTIDTYKSDSREYITLTGVLDGNNLSIKGAQTKVNIVDAPDSFNLKALDGHRLKVTGYYAGTAKPMIRIMLTNVIDEGIGKVIFFKEDFEWLDEWSVAGKTFDAVGTNNIETSPPQIVTPKVDGVSALDALLNKGYEFLRVTTSKPDECIYLQRNYLKMGKTKYQAGIILPQISNVPEETQTVLSFDWSPMRQATGKIDPVNLIVIVNNDGVETTFDIPESGFENGHKLEWIRAKVPLEGMKITSTTKITIRQTQWPATTANRWFIDNIDLSELDE